MFVPMRSDPDQLDQRPEREGSRPFSAGAAVLVTATVVVPYALTRLREAVPGATATLDWRKWQRQKGAGAPLLLFEAFVSDRPKKRVATHAADAKAAARAFQDDIQKVGCAESVVTVGRAFNILGAMMMRTGWARSPRVLSEPCLVIRPDFEQLEAICH